MVLAQEMWDYLKSIGFEDIPRNDERLGYQTNWLYNIARGDLCAFRSLSGYCILPNVIKPS